MSVFQRLLLAGLSVYRKAISPLLPATCRFHPTCSRYAAQAIEKHGAIRGSIMACRRIGRCHPWNPGGFDPVENPTGKNGVAR